MELRSNLTEFSRLIFGADTTCKQARKFWEPSSPTTQCNNVPITGPFLNGTICYICGMQIKKVTAAAAAAAADNTDDSDDSDENGKDGRNPECEHILPIGLAIIYLGLYSPSFKDSEWYNKDILKYEYAWAHRTCNQIKSDESFITVNADNTEFNVNNTNLENFLGRIWTTTRNDSQKFKEELHRAYDDNEKKFITNRMNSLNSPDDTTPSLKKFQDIKVFLDTSAAPSLVLLAGVCCALEGNLKSKEGQQKQRCIKDPAAAEKIRQEENERLKTKLGAEYDKYITKKYKDMSSPEKYKDIASTDREYYIEIMMRLSNSYFKEWIEFIKNDIQIKLMNNEINTLQKSTNSRYGSTRALELKMKKLEEKNIQLHAVNNAATIVTAEKKLLEDAWVLLPGKAIKNVNTTAAAKILDEIRQSLYTISLLSNSSNTNMRNRGAAGPNRGAAGPNRGAAGPNRGAAGPNRGAAGPNRGAAGPNRGAAGPNRGAAGPNTAWMRGLNNAWMRGLNNAGRWRQQLNATRRATAAARFKQSHNRNIHQEGDAKRPRYTGGRKTCKRKSRNNK